VLAAMTVTGGMLAAPAADEPAAATAAGAAAVAPFKARWNEAKVPWLKEAAHYVVATDGKAENKGTVESPWDLASVFEGKHQFGPGSVARVRGGRYGTGGTFSYTISLTGTAEKPIVVRACPGERATINGGVTHKGAHTWLWGLEISNDSTDILNRSFAGNIYGKGSKWINVIVHDGGHPAPGFWRDTSPGGELNGIICWANGNYSAPGTGFAERGSMYGQNESGMNYIVDTIQFRQFTCGVFCGSSGGASACSPFTVEGNVCFDNPWWNYLFQTGKKPMTDIKLIGNFAWARRDDKHKGSVQLQYYTVDSESLEVRDNYFVLGDAGERELYLKRWKNVTFTGNTVVGPNRLVHVWTTGTKDGYKWDNNRYYGGRQHDPAVENSFRTFVFDKVTTNFEGWKTASGFDKASSWSKDYPTGVKILVRPNQYEPGRGHVIVYNWDKKPAAEADVSCVLKAGDKFEVRDAQNYFGKPVLEGAYDGKPLALPMNLTEVAQPVGEVPHLKARYSRHTAPEFAVFVVMAKP